MKKKGIKLFAWLLIMSMLLSFIPDISVKAEDDELPTIEELAEIFDPYAQLLTDKTGFGTSWVGYTHCIDLMSFVNNELGSDYEIIKKENEYIILGTKIGYAVELKFSGDELTEVVFLFGILSEEFKVDKSLASVPKLMCTNPKHQFRQAGSGCHVYMVPNGKGGSDIRYIYGEWCNWWRKSGNDPKSIYAKLEPGKMYYISEEKDENGKHLVEECNCGHEGHRKSKYYGQEYIAATCTEPGIEPYFWCPICSTYFDYDKKEYKFSELPIIIPINPNAHPCDGSVYLFDEESHWHPTTCIHKDARCFEFLHRYDEEGICEVCGYKKEDIKPGEDVKPSEEPTAEPTKDPEVKPTVKPVVKPTVVPSEEPSIAPSEEPTAEPTKNPEVKPTVKPVVKPTVVPSEEPSIAPSEEPTVEPTVKPSEAPVIVKGTSYDTLEVSEILKSNGKFKALTVSENNGVLTVPAGTKLELSNVNWNVKGYYDGRVVSANQIKWEASDDSKASIKALKKYTVAKYNKKANVTKLTTKANKKVAGSVYAVKLVDDKNNTIILNIERDEINKAVKKTKLSKADSKQSVSANTLASMKDSTGVKTVNLSLAGLDEGKKSAFNNNAITWIVGSGKNAVILKPGKVTAYETKKGAVAYLTVTDDASVKVLSGDTKGTIKLSATVDRKSFKTSIKVK